MTLFEKLWPRPAVTTTRFSPPVLEALDDYIEWINTTEGREALSGWLQRRGYSLTEILTVTASGRGAEKQITRSTLLSLLVADHLSRNSPLSFVTET